MDDQKWAEFYRSDKSNTRFTFIKVMTDDGEHFFCREYDHWHQVKDYCDKKSVFIQDLHLQFRSNRCIIDVKDIDAIYVVRSVLGAMGQETKHYLTIGTLSGDTVSKAMYLVPELIIEKEYEDTLSNCFDEALIYNEKKRTHRKKQV